MAMSMQSFEQQMKAAGFTDEDPGLKNRLIMSLSGREKQGKTHFALSAPDPLAYINFDVGDEGVIDKFRGSGKTIFHRRFSKPMTFKDGAPVADGALAEWLRLTQSWYKLLAIPDLKTIVADTETEIWELIRLARLGKLTQVKPFHYGPVNAEYDAFLKAAYESDKNIILIGKSKKEYTNDKWNGGYERAGFSNLGFIVQVVAEMHRYGRAELSEDDDPVLDSYACRIISCRHNPALEGCEFNNRNTCNFEHVQMSVLAKMDPEDCEAYMF